LFISLTRDGHSSHPETSLLSDATSRKLRFSICFWNTALFFPHDMKMMDIMHRGHFTYRDVVPTHAQPFQSAFHQSDDEGIFSSIAAGLDSPRRTTSCGSSEPSGNSPAPATTNVFRFALDEPCRRTHTVPALPTDLPRVQHSYAPSGSYGQQGGPIAPGHRRSSR
jgi:hypothetical protein